MSEKQLLIESSDFNLTCNLSEKDRENLTESLKISAGKHGNLIVKNIPCTILDRRNQNGRIYPTALMQKAINEAMPKMKAKMLVCSASEHPSGSFCEPANISHAVINAYIKNVEIEVEGKKERHNVLFNDWEVLNEKSQVAAHVQQLILSGFGIGTSIRSLGSCDPDGTVTELEYLGTDIVGQPSSSTYVNMPINESVEVSTMPLTETYIVSASATNVVRDLDSALALSQQIDDAQFGTVKKTSTKLDSEVDPKTGAETTMVTLETETEDEVTELDQALMMAKRAIMNGKADIDSVTIENVKEEQPKESVENSEVPLNEDDTNLGLKKIIDIKGVEITGPDEKELWRIAEELRKTNDHNAIEWQRSYKSLTDAGIDQRYLDYANGKDMTEGKDTEYSFGKEEQKNIVDNLLYNIQHMIYYDGLTLEQACRKFSQEHEGIPYEYILKYVKPGLKENNNDDNWLEDDKNLFKTLYYSENGIDKNGTRFEFIPLDDKNVKVVVTTQMKKADGSEEPLVGEEIAPYDRARTYWHRLKASGLYDYEQIEVTNNKYVPESIIREAKEENEDPNEGKQYVLKTDQGFVSMDGNAIKFVDNPKEAIHFVKGKEESGVIHLSGIKKILDTMGIYDTENYFKKDTIDISAEDDVNIQAAETDGIKVEECGKTITEDNGSNTRYSAHVSISNSNGVSEEDIPVSATEMESINNEVGNLYNMKIQKGGNVEIIVTDTTTGEKLKYNPELHMIEPLEIPQTESAGELEQNGNKLSMQIDDNNTIEKEFKNSTQATIAKAGIEQGKLGGDVLLSEDENDWKIGVVFNNLDYGNEEALYNNADPTSNQSIFSGDKPTKIRVTIYPEELKDISDRREVLALAKQKLEDKLGAFGHIIDLDVFAKNEEYPQDGIYNLIETKEDDKEESDTAKCAWCGEEFEKSALRKEKDLGYLCNTCAKGIASREGTLTFEEAENDIPVRQKIEYEDIEPGWYATGKGVGIVGPYNTEKELRDILGTEICEIVDSDKGLVSINYVEPDELSMAAESAPIDEVMYNEPSEASDAYIIKPLQDATANEVVFEVANIDWDVDDLYDNFLVNYQLGDPVSFGDLESKMKDLPSETSIKIDTTELPDNIDPQALKAYIIDKLEKTYVMNINNADILSMHYVN